MEIATTAPYIVIIVGSKLLGCKDSVGCKIFEVTKISFTYEDIFAVKSNYFVISSIHRIMCLAWLKEGDRNIPDSTRQQWCCDHGQLYNERRWSACAARDL